jgi:hypothetical protein
MAASSRGATFVYSWSGGSAGFTGELVLDSPSSPVGGGTPSDIISAVITDPAGTFDLNPSTIYIFQAPFAWTPSGITSMWIDWYVPSGAAGFGQNLLFTGVNFEGSDTSSGYYVDTKGSWNTQPVPETASTLGLAVLAAGGLLGIRRKLQRV